MLRRVPWPKKCVAQAFLKKTAKSMCDMLRQLKMYFLVCVFVWMCVCVCVCAPACARGCVRAGECARVVLLLLRLMLLRVLLLLFRLRLCLEAGLWLACKCLRAGQCCCCCCCCCIDMAGCGMCCYWVGWGLRAPEVT
jgi:hypothetical protein